MTTTLMPLTVCPPALRDQYLALLATFDLTAEDVPTPAVKYSPSQPRDDHGRWVKWVNLGSVPQINIALMARHPFTTFDFTGSTVENANAVAQAVEAMAAEYPEVFRHVRFIGTGEGPNSDPYWDTYWRAHNNDAVSTSKMEIALNPRLMGAENAAALLKPQEDQHYWPPGTGSVQATFTHEFGHIVHSVLESSGDQPSPWHHHDTVGGELDRLDGKYGDEGLNISQYARDGFETKHTYAETWAEAFVSQYYAPPAFQDNNAYIVAQKQLLANLAHGQVPLKTPARPAS